MTGFFTSPRIAWGPGAIEQLSGLGIRRAFVVVDATIASRQGERRVAEELAKSEAVVEVVAVGPEANRLDAVEKLAKRAQDFAPDWVVAVGGGRTLDAAKAARLLLERPDLSVAALPPVLELPDALRCRSVAIPTTSGSGSEASATVDLRTPEEEPVELTHRALVPDWALVDASFAGTLSNDLRCDGAAETLAQASEAYLSAWANPFSDALALSALRTVVERLPHAVRWSDDPDAREELHYAATLAGLAASNAQRGVAHALARALVAVTDLSYARLVGVLLPYVLEFDQPSARDRLEVASGVMRRPDDATSLPASVRLRRFYESVRFPTDLKSAGVPPERLAGAESTVVARALRSPGVLANPRVPSAADLGALLTSAMLGTSVR